MTDKPVGPVAPWGGGDVVKGIVLAVVLLIVLGAGVMVVMAVLGPAQNPFLIPSLLIVQDLCLLTGVWVFGLRKYRLGLDGLGLRPFLASLGCGYAAVALPAALAFNAFYTLALKYGLGYEVKQTAILPYFGEGLPGFALALFIVSLVAPFLEEMFFRGFVFAGLTRRLGLWGAAVISGAIFSLAHLNVDTFIPLNVFGVILALLYSATGSLYPGILMHSVNNTLGLLAAYLQASGIMPTP